MPTRSRRVEWIQGSSEFNEVYSRGLQYALVSDDYRQVNHFVFCKDFLHDMVFSKLNGEGLTIYKFSYNPDKDIPICDKKIRIALANCFDKNFASRVEHSLDFINQFEDAIQFQRSKVYSCEDPPEKYKVSGVFLFEGSRRWLNAPPLMSLYSLLLRVGMAHQKGSPYMDTLKGIAERKIAGYQTNDFDQCRRGLPGIQRILQEGPEKIFHRQRKKNYPEKMGPSTIHNRFGIVSFAEKTTELYVPKWHRTPKED